MKSDENLLEMCFKSLAYKNKKTVLSVCWKKKKRTDDDFIHPTHSIDAPLLSYQSLLPLALAFSYFSLAGAMCACILKKRHKGSGVLVHMSK